MKKLWHNVPGRIIHCANCAAAQPNRAPRFLGPKTQKFCWVYNCKKIKLTYLNCFYSKAIFGLLICEKNEDIFIS
jgi:hypothetical protein